MERNNGDAPIQRGALAERLDELFARVTYSDARGRSKPYSNQHVAQAISDDHSHATTITREYLSTLRSGHNTNPTLAVIRAIAKFFDDHKPLGMPPITAATLLNDSEDEPDPTEEELRQRLVDKDVRAIAMRAGEMSPAVRRQLLRIIDTFDTEESP